jgi:hypothetical protein
MTDLQTTWEDRINRALAKRDEGFMKPFQVELARKFYEGAQNQGLSKEETVVVNKIYSHMMVELPSLYAIDPFFYIKLKRSFNPNPLMVAMYEAKAKIRQAYLNYLKGELKLKTKARLGIQDAFFSYGVMKTYYSADMVENEDYGNDVLDDDGDPLIGDDGQPVQEPEHIPINEKYCWNRVHPDDIIWDEDAGTLEDKWCFIAERVRMTPEEAKADPTISNASLREGNTVNKDSEKEGQGFLKKLFSSNSHKVKEDDREIYIIWEIYDLKNKKWLKILEGGEEPVMKPQSLPKGVENHPYSILRFVLRDNSPYPIPPISQAIDPQKDLNDARSKIKVHRKRFSRKYGCLEGAIDEDEIDKFENGGDGTIVKWKQHDALKPIQDASQANSDFQELGLINNDIIEMLGSSQQSRGMPGSDSATEAALIDKRMEIKEGDKLSLVNDWIVDMSGKMDQLVQAHITKDEAVKIAGPSGEAWELVRAADYEEIEGEFEYSVNVGATLPRLPQVERAQFMAVLQVFASFPHLLTQPRLLKHILELHHIDDPLMMEQLQQLGKKILGGAVPMPGGGGSQAGVSEENPIAAMLGQAFGDQGGTTNGGGAPQLEQAQ